MAARWLPVLLIFCAALRVPSTQHCTYLRISGSKALADHRQGLSDTAAAAQGIWLSPIPSARYTCYRWCQQGAERPSCACVCWCMVSWVHGNVPERPSASRLGALLGRALADTCSDGAEQGGKGARQGGKGAEQGRMLSWALGRSARRTAKIRRWRRERSSRGEPLLPGQPGRLSAGGWLPGNRCIAAAPAGSGCWIRLHWLSRGTQPLQGGAQQRAASKPTTAMTQPRPLAPSQGPGG